MLIGFSEEIINIDKECWLSGYYPLRKCEQKHLDLKARSFVFKDEKYYCLIQLDVIAVDDDFVDQVKCLLSKYGFEKDNIIICATHTHSGPTGLLDTSKPLYFGLDKIFGIKDDDIINAYLKAIELSVASSLEDMQPFKMGFTKSVLNSEYSNRHDIQYSYDNDILVISFITKNNKKGLIYNLSCHPTILNGNSKIMSPDFCGVVENKLEGYQVCAFINGSAGDVSTRFTRKSSGVDQLEITGAAISNKIMDMIKNINYHTVNNIGIFNWKYDVLCKEFDSEEVAKKKLDDAQHMLKSCKDINQIRLLQSLVEGATLNLLYAKNPNKIDRCNFNIAMLKINDLKLVAIPGELFSHLGKLLKDKYGCSIMGYTNGYNLYIVDEKGYEKDCYESKTSLFKKGEAEKLIKFISDKIVDTI
ncbi:MAG: neutral/alkaline non-lysosomal ceramidase N-terminal domain-containing protein [Erysipelotrichaceae bacterium]